MNTNQVARIAGLVGEPARTSRDPVMRFARTCYDHLAARLAVAIADRFVEDGAVVSKTTPRT